MNDAPLVAGTAVVLHGDTLRVALDAALIAVRARRLSGLPIDNYRQLALALHTAMMATNGHMDVPETPTVATSIAPTVTVEQAAEMLGLSRRQTRRLAPRLGGRIIAGRWLLDEMCIKEHLEGKTNGERPTGATPSGIE